MIMRAKQEGQTIIFELEGHLDFETTQQFKNTCTQLIQNQKSPRVIFNLEKLKFVGSSGINQFIEIMKDFNNKKVMKPKPKFCHLSTEFERVFKAYQTTRNPFEIFDSENAANEAFDTPTKRGRKPKSN